ncbi:PCRF domain-containing protein, partial [Candidatus Bipolaricaulota bacterium]|nr:PCRF domain-containing protein [Candidatus Bipolaricaulota bacterium]
MITFDPAGIEAEISDLEKEMASPGFWEDRERATEASRELERNRSILSRYRALTEDIEEVEVLHQMAVEMTDEEELKALLPRLSSLEERVRALRIELTFSDPYDLADCYLSINAGAGGTDSQDWAEML